MEFMILHTIEVIIINNNQLIGDIFFNFQEEKTLKNNISCCRVRIKIERPLSKVFMLYVFPKN